MFSALVSEGRYWTQTMSSGYGGPSRVSFAKRVFNVLFEAQAPQIIMLSMENLWSVRTIRQKLFVFAWRNRKPNRVYVNSKWTLFLWANCSHIKSDRTNETSARSWSWGAGLQNRMGIFRYSYWLLCNSFVKFADQNFSDALRRRPLEEIYLKNGVPPGPNFKAIR